MTQIEEKVIDSTFQFSAPVTAKSPELQALFDFIALGASDRDRILPYNVVELIRRSRLGALRIPVAEGGGGSTARELFEVVIRLGDADPNVAHIVRNHFSVTIPLPISVDRKLLRSLKNSSVQYRFGGMEKS